MIVTWPADPSSSSPSTACSHSTRSDLTRCSPGRRRVLAAKEAGEPPATTCRMVSEHGTPITTESGLQIVTAPFPAGRTKIDTLLIPGGEGSQTARYDAALIDWIRKAARSSRRVATVCSGTFIGAEAGLLDGRTVTTHWARAQQLADEYPAADGRCRPDLHTRRERVDVGRRDRRHRPGAGNGRGRLRQRDRPDRGTLDGDVPASSGRPDSVRCAGVDAAGRSHRPCAPRRTTSTTIPATIIDSIFWRRERR